MTLELICPRGATYAIAAKFLRINATLMAASLRASV